MNQIEDNIIKNYDTLRVMNDIQNHNSQKSLATSLDLSVGKTNYIVKALCKKGLLKAQNFLNSNSKLKYRYILTQDGIKEKISLTKNFIKIKKKEYEDLEKQLQNDISKKDNI